jgi:hypothetical protein
MVYPATRLDKPVSIEWRAVIRPMRQFTAMRQGLEFMVGFEAVRTLARSAWLRESIPPTGVKRTAMLQRGNACH